MELIPGKSWIYRTWPESGDELELLDTWFSVPDKMSTTGKLGLYFMFHTMQKSVEDKSPLSTRGLVRKLVWVSLGPKHSIGPGRIEGRVRSLAGEKVPRRRDAGQMVNVAPVY